MNKKSKDDIKLVGSMSWTKFREFIIESLGLCRTEVEFTHFLMALFNSMGTKEQLIERRKNLGLDFKDLEDI